MTPHVKSAELFQEPLPAALTGDIVRLRWGFEELFDGNINYFEWRCCGWYSFYPLIENQDRDGFEVFVVAIFVFDDGAFRRSTQRSPPEANAITFIVIRTELFPAFPSYSLDEVLDLIHLALG